MSTKGSAESYVELRGSLSIPEAITGKSAYEIALLNGFEGTEEEWLEYIYTRSPVEADDFGLEQDEKTNFVFPTFRGVRSKQGIPIAASGGGGGTTSVGFKVNNVSGWLAKTIAHGASCSIALSWESIEDEIPTGNGTLKVAVNDQIKETREIAQGNVVVDVGKYLVAGSNDVSVTITDTYANYRTIKFTITAISASISSYFDAKTAYTGEIPYSYTPTGAIEKTVHFLVDGEEVGTQTVTESNREQSYTIPAQPHGSHNLEVYFTGEVDGQDIESNHLYYDLICYEEGRTEPIIATAFNTAKVKQYSTVLIPYIVYTPSILTSSIELKDGENTVVSLTVDRTQQTWAYKATEYGTAQLSIVCGETVKDISFEITESDINVTATETNLELHLSSEGRSNGEENPLSWSYGGISAEMTGFNLKSDGWKEDDDGNTVLRVAGDARVNIPFNIFGKDFRTSGKTVEIEFATRDVMNYDAVVFSCWSGERGIKITAQKALLKSEQSEIFTQYKENEHVRIAFSVEKRAENRLLAIYINGIMSGVVQYPDDDDFSQTDPVGISIGSNECITDIYRIRVYGNNLTRYQILDNWIADTQNIDEMTDRYVRNDIFDEYGNISISKIPSDIPYLVLNASSYDALPQSKGDKKTVSGQYVDPVNSERGFYFENAEIDVQGTSSAGYSRKNYKINFKNGFLTPKGYSETYQLRAASMPTDTFTFKADVASSEGANNVELAMLYNDVCPVKTPPQQTDSRVRQGIEGYPCLIFYYDGTKHTFIGKYNFNNDKATEEVFGFKSGDESWEILQNNTQMVIWKDDNFEGDAWKLSFEGRYPDKNTDTTNLQAFSTWLKSTDTTAVATEEEKAERIAKFKNEFADYCNVDAMLFNYIFTEMFLMTDNRAKNAFPTRYDEDGKWLILPYDFDTAMGINNAGELKFGYALEDIDLVDGKNVYNGQDSVLYVNMRLAFADEIKQMYKDLRAIELFSYEEIEKRFENHQGVWDEAIFNEDARFKYIDPLVNDGNSYYLPMLQGSKAEQRKWWLYNRFRYLDSKYDAGDSLSDNIKLRAYGVSDITVTPYADIYATVDYDGAIVKTRALRGDSYTLENPLTAGNEADIDIYSASQLSSIGDLSGLKLSSADFSKAIRLSSLKLGDGASDYNNPKLTNLTIGNLTLLKELDVRNCSALTQSVDLSGCTNIERAYFEGTAITGVKLPDGGVLKTLHLPFTVSALTIQNQKQLTDFKIPAFVNLSTLRLENVDWSVFNVLSIIEKMQANARVRLIGIDYTCDSVGEILALYDKFDTFRGIDENGGNLDKAVISGTIHVGAVSNTDLDEFNRRYPNINIDYEVLGYAVKYISDGEILYADALLPGEEVPIIDDPTKESTTQHNYTFKGWSLDGETVTTIPKIMGEEDLIFTALYDEELATFTVRFINGSTVLQTVTVPYGSDALYTGDTPVSDEGDDYTFEGWNPSPENITEDTDCYAVFAEPFSLADATWADISNISASGQAANIFAIGDTKAVHLKGTVGTLELDATYYVYILGFNHNSEVEGNGIHFGTFKSDASNGIDLCLVDSKYTNSSTDGTKYFNMNHWGHSNYGGWAGCDMRYDILGSTDKAPSGYGAAKTTSVVGYDPSNTCATTPVAGTLMAALPADLRAVMKPMTKYSNNTGNSGDTEEKVTVTTDYLPLLAEFEIFGARTYANSYEQNKQKQYDYFAAGNSKKKYRHSSTGQAARWRERSAYYDYSGSFCSVNTNGNVYLNNADDAYGVAPIFKV